MTSHGNGPGAAKDKTSAPPEPSGIGPESGHAISPPGPSESAVMSACPHDEPRRGYEAMENGSCPLCLTAERDTLSAELAAARAALQRIGRMTEFDAVDGNVGPLYALAYAALSSPSAAADAHDARVRAEERERVLSAVARHHSPESVRSGWVRLRPVVAEAVDAVRALATPNKDSEP